MNNTNKELTIYDLYPKPIKEDKNCNICKFKNNSTSWQPCRACLTCVGIGLGRKYFKTDGGERK